MYSLTFDIKKKKKKKKKKEKKKKKKKDKKRQYKDSLHCVFINSKAMK